MAAQAYSVYVPDVTVFATGAPPLIVVDALKRAARDFFSRSLCYRAWLAVFDLTANTTTYTIPGLPTDTEVAKLLELKCNGVDVGEVSHPEFFALDNEWPSLEGEQPQRWTTLARGQFSIIPEPQATYTGAFNAFVALTPTVAATGAEQAYLEDWRDAIVDGALSYLMTMKARTWFDPNEAKVRKASFERGIWNAKIKAEKGNNTRDVHVRMRRWV